MLRLANSARLGNLARSARFHLENLYYLYRYVFDSDANVYQDMPVLIVRQISMSVIWKRVRMKQTVSMESIHLVVTVYLDLQVITKFDVFHNDLINRLYHNTIFL